jgi:hypothetical protein
MPRAHRAPSSALTLIPVAGLVSGSARREIYRELARLNVIIILQNGPIAVFAGISPCREFR